MKSFLSELEYEHRFTLICGKKQKQTDKQAAMKLMGSMLSNCNNHLIFYSVNPILMVIFVIILYAFRKGHTAHTPFFVGVCVEHLLSVVLSVFYLCYVFL